MPRLSINFENTQIYRFVCNDVNILNTYVGSTTNWSHRKANHKSACNKLNNKIYNLNVYQTIRANGGWDNWNMILVECYPCNNNREAEQREQYWKEHYNDNMGSIRAFITKEQIAKRNVEYYATNKEHFAKYYATNKEQIAKRKSEYYATHKEQILEKKAEYYATHKKQLKL